MQPSGGRSLAALIGAVLPTVGGACCATLGVGLAGLGAAGGSVVALVSTVAAPLAMITLGGLLLWRLRRPTARWRRWQALAAVAAGSYLAVALAVLPVVGWLVGPAGSSPALP